MFRPRWQRYKAYILFTGLLGLVALWSPYGQLQKLNRVIQDSTIAAANSTPDSQIILVAIDNHSIENLGRWPWRRAWHAELINRIGEAQPKAIGFDVLFTESDKLHPGDDLLFAAALARNPPVVLPVFLQVQGNLRIPVSPIPELRTNASGLGVANIDIDDDGVVRRIPAHQAVPGVPPPFALAVYQAAGHMPEKNVNKQLIPFVGGGGTFPQVSYLDVLQGRVSQEVFRGKYVLIGATADGMTDLYATPTLSNSRLMPGVEIVANILNAYAQQADLKPAPGWLNIVMNTGVCLLALCAAYFMRPRQAILFTLFLGILLWAMSTVTVSHLGLLLNPAAALLGLPGLYIFWSWYRLEVATRYLIKELDSLHQSGLPALDTPLRLQDFLSRRIAALEGATLQLRTLHRFIKDAVDTLPYPILIADETGIVRIANQVSGHHFDTPLTDLAGQHLHHLLMDTWQLGTEIPILPTHLNDDSPHAYAGESIDKKQRRLMSSCTPIYGLQQQHSGWIVTLIDISILRQAEQAREETFRFVAHDIRAPLSAIISLLELRKLEAGDPPLAQIELLAEEALALADGILDVSRAEAGEYYFELINGIDVLEQACQDMWGLAKKADVKLVLNHPQSVPIWADPAMLKRALVNLINNAIKYSPPTSSVICSINVSEYRVLFSVQDNGPGIAEEQLIQLFKVFGRVGKTANDRHQGKGLGLAFVKAVAAKHEGKVWVQTSVNQGSTFYMELPFPAPSR